MQLIEIIYTLHWNAIKVKIPSTSFSFFIVIIVDNFKIKHSESSQNRAIADQVRQKILILAYFGHILNIQLY